MTVLIYVDTNKQVGDADHLKVFANADAAETWFETGLKTIQPTIASLARRKPPSQSGDHETIPSSPCLPLPHALQTRHAKG
jgi:hypothetical protein